MAEPKKVALQTLVPMKKDKKKESKSRTVRFTLTLTESNEKSCPEFNYGELVSEHLRKLMGRKSLGDVINTPMLDPTDPFAGNEDEALKVLAKQFERKYGTGTHTGKKKKRNRNLDDFNVLGEGYDETDPFIDNSDAYDGVMPTHIETKHGGFYINSGELNFCEVDTSQDSVQSEVEAPRKRKANCLDSDSESDHANHNEDGEVMPGSDEDSKNLVENGNLKNKCRKLDEGELLRRRKMMISKMNAKKLEKKEKEEKPINGNDKGSEGGEGTTGTKAIAASIEAVVSKARQETNKTDEDEQEEEDNDSGSSSSTSGSSDSDSSDSSSSSENESDGEEENNNKNSAGAENGLDPDQQGMSGEDEDHTPLPENLPDDLLQVLNQIKEVGRASKGSSQKFFTDSVNKMLLSIEMKLNRIGSRKKTKIYNHLANHLPCGTQTLVKRAKNLLSEWQETRLREPLKRLKEVVDKAMPSLIEEHALECQKMAESKGEEGSDEVNNKEEEGNEEGGGGGGTTKKKARLPKKKFIFTEEIRQYLCNVVKVRVKFWQMVKKRSETADEHILGFLDSEVKPLWPKGWVTGRILYKESYQAHGVITDKNFKPSVNRKVGGGGSGSGSANNSPSRPSQPPRPSLTATALPKSSPGSNKSSPGPSSPVGTAGRSSASVGKVPGGPATPNATSGTIVKTATPPPMTPPSVVAPSTVEAITTGTTTVKAVAASTGESPAVSDNNVKKVVIEKKFDGEKKDRSETSAQSKGGNTVEGSKTVNSKIGSPSDTVRLGLGKEDKNVDSSKITSGKSSGLTTSGLSSEKGGGNESRSASVDGAKSGGVSQKDSGSVGVPKSGGSLTIKTVDKINENVMQKQCSPAVSIIDLSSDEEKSTENMLAKSGDKTRVTDMKSKGSDVRTCSSAGEAKESGSSAKSKSVYSSSKKDDDLDEKLDSVMNEILQISRQMSGENSNKKLNEAKETGSPAPRHSISNKPQPQPQPQPQQQQLQQTKVRKSSGMQQQPPPPRNVPQQSKGSSVLVSGPWNKQEVSLTTVHSNSASGATSWAGKEISPARQRNTTEVYNMVADPLANLRTMQGLSVSSVSRKLGAPHQGPQPIAHLGSSHSTNISPAIYSSGASKTSGTSNVSSSSSSRLPNLGAGVSIVRPSGTSSHGYSSVSKQTTQPATAKQRSESFTSSQSTTSSNHSLYNSLTPEQHMNLLKQQQQQQQQPQQQSHKQQHLLSQMNSASTPFLSSMANVNSDVLSFMDSSMNSLDVFNSTQKGSNKHKSQYW